MQIPISDNILLARIPRWLCCLFSSLQLQLQSNPPTRSPCYGSVGQFAKMELSFNEMFAGNSYTYYNDLPTIVSKVAKAAGEEIEFESHLEVNIGHLVTPVDALLFTTVLLLTCAYVYLANQGGWSWEKHWNSNETLDKISSRGWDVVVLQVREALKTNFR